MKAWAVPILTAIISFCSSTKKSQVLIVETEDNIHNINGAHGMTVGDYIYKGNIEEERILKEHGDYTLSKLKRKIYAYQPVTVTANVLDLSKSDQQVLKHLIKAASHIDKIFNRQAFNCYQTNRKQLKEGTGRLAKAQLELYDIMRGPWDRVDHYKPFAVDSERPKGGGLYPVDFEKVDFLSFIENHPDKKEEMENHLTMILHKGNNLQATNYSVFFQPYLNRSKKCLLDAAKHTENKSLKKFLRSRTSAFQTNDYKESEKDWMAVDSKINIAIGPFYTSEDQLMHIKLVFGAFVTIADPQESKMISRYKNLMQDMENNLPIPDGMKRKNVQWGQINVCDIVYSSGAGRKNIQFLGFSLPRDRNLRKEIGSKKVLLKNNIVSKFNSVLVPIAKKLMNSSQLSYLDQEAFFNTILFHEISQSLGPVFVKNAKTNGYVKTALGPSYGQLELALANSMGVYNILFMIQQGELPAEFKEMVLFTHIAGMFRNIRFGVVETYGKAAAVQLNHYIKEKGVEFDSDSKTFNVNFEMLEKSVRNLVKKLCTMEHDGVKKVVDNMFEQYSKLDENTLASLNLMRNIPIDIKPCYPLADEEC